MAENAPERLTTTKNKELWKVVDFEYKICKFAEIINWFFNSLDVTDNVTFLQTNVENEVEILRAWEATYEYRMTKLSATGLDFMSTHEYFELYPYLKEQNGWKLVIK